MAERRVPTPVVLALASGMASVGVVAYFAATRADEPEEPTGIVHQIEVDARMPETAAEAFLDAWRKRDHGICRDLSVEGALEAVILRQEEDEALSEEDREIKGQVWDAMATSRLDLEVRESETVDPSTIILGGLARGDFLGRPYEREIEFTMVKIGDGWKVARMGLGDIVSDMPDFLEMPEGSYDPSEFEVQGDDIP